MTDLIGSDGIGPNRWRPRHCWLSGEGVHPPNRCGGGGQVPPLNPARQVVIDSAPKIWETKKGFPNMLINEHRFEVV